MKPDLPSELCKFLEDRNIYKTGVNIRQDGVKLFRDFGVPTNGLVELITMANSCGSPKLEYTHLRSLRILSGLFIGEHMPKGRVRLSNWARAKLSHPQIQYAATDAYAGMADLPVIHISDEMHTIRESELKKQKKKVANNAKDGQSHSSPFMEDQRADGKGQTMAQQDVYTLDEAEYESPYYTIRTDYTSRFRDEHTPIIIDNGSYQCRAGWATEDKPSLIFDNVVSRYKDRKANVNIMSVGMDAYADPAGRSNARSPFDSNVVCDFDRMEWVLDYIFITLGINASSINHPIIMTEPVCVPLHSRKRRQSHGMNQSYRQLTPSEIEMSELLFECYNVPSVVYGIDSLFSFYANGGLAEEGGITISAGHTATHIIPTLHGKGLLERTKRISYGGTQSTEYMLKLMQLKYPTFPTKMTSSQAQELMHNHCYVAGDYQETLRRIEDRETFLEIDRVIQFPFTAPVVEEKTEEELARQAAKREENARRLREAAAKSRLEKLVRREQEFEAFTRLKNAKGTMKKADWMAQLKETGFKDEADLDDTLKQLDTQIQRARNKELGIDESEEKEPPLTNLVDIPDEELSESERKEKRKQKLMKANYDARLRAKKAKEEAKAREEDQARLEQEKRLRDPEKWVEEIKEKRQRKRLAAELADRRSRASQMRMRSIANLANDSPTSKRRRKGQEEDTFGADDEDWMIYREISREDESDEEEEDLSLLNQYESLLLQYDPEFLPEHSYEATSSPTNTLLHLLARGLYPPYDPTDIGQMHQLHVNVERVRVPEVLFQPSIIGLDQAGLVETVNDIVKTFEPDQRSKVMKNVFVTGGFSQLSGFPERVMSSMRSIFPVGTKINVQRAKNPMIDAWRGAAMFAQDPSYQQYRVSKQEYEEYGGEYIKEHGLGNLART
ncbi:Nuclear actin-protein involved in chromatin remodeling [Apophysomyces ossiformis]|uniref:Nuclear actin-protein involved in chromatin remodeling n=1 Tax=Apophysomyces ossiformis TaxID=679940 RepID=A0A8H7BZA1_9FUNG|nr:Nuclear actin-protein involved in chromatin remodeling [Apophysomyces ossiformis]